MFQPKYQLSSKIIANIAQIERFYGQIEGLKIPKKLELNLERKNLIQSSYSSNKIEGNPLTLPEVTNLLLDDRVPTNRDEKEVVNYFDILKELEKYEKKEINLAFVKEIHEKLMRGVDKNAGVVRDVPVVIGKPKKLEGKMSLRIKHNPPYHKKEKIEKALKELFDWLKKSNDLPIVVRTGIFHHQFVYIHPFEDGNGRLCRILSSLMFLKSGYRINKYFVLDDYYDIDRIDYSDHLHSADLGDKTKWLEYYSDGVKYSLKSALGKFSQALTTLRAEERLTPKEKEVYKIIDEKKEITSHDLVQILSVSRQQAHGLLKSLVKKSLIDKKGSTKSSYYFIK